MRAEFFDVAGHTVIETRTDGNQYITVVHRHVGFIGTVHAEHADKLRVSGWIGTQPHQGIGDGKIQYLGQLGERLGRITENDTTTGIENRPFGSLHQLHCTLDLTAVPNMHRVVGTHTDLVRVAERGFIGGNVLGNIHHHRTRTPRGRDIKRLLYRLGQIVDVLHQEVVFYTGTRNTNVIRFLEGIIADQVRRHLASEDHQGNGIHVCGGNTGHRIGCART